MAAFQSDIGVYEPWWGATPAKMGDVAGNTQVRIATTVARSHRAATGGLTHESVISGHELEVMTPLAGLSLAEMEPLFPNCTLNGLENKLLLNNAVGYSLKDNAQALILKPILNGSISTDQRTWLTFPAAHPLPEWDIENGPEDVRIYMVRWEIYKASTGVLAQLGASGSAG